MKNRIKRKLNIHFRTHANYHVLTKNWKYKMYCVLIKLTDEVRRIEDELSQHNNR